MNRRLVLPVLLALLGLAVLPGRRVGRLVPRRGQRRRSTAPRLTSTGSAASTWRVTAPAASSTSSASAACPHVFLSRFNGGQFRPPERVDNGIAAARDRRGDRRHRRRPAGDRVDGRQQRLREHRRRRRPAPGPLLGPTELFAGARAGHRPLGRHGHQRRRLRLLHGAGRRRHRRPRRAGCRTRRGRRSARRWTSTRPRRRAWATSARASACRRRATGSWRGARAATLYARRVTGDEPVGGAAAAVGARRRRRAGRRGRLAGDRHRGRRLVRVGGLPAGRRRRLARARAADAGLDLRPAAVPSTAAAARPRRGSP